MIVILIGFCVLGFGILLVQLFMIQIVEGEFYQSRAAELQTRAVNLTATRGAIYDRNGTTLVRSADVWNICISPADLLLNEDITIPEIAKDLSEILDVDAAYIIEQSADTKSYYKRIARRVEVETREKVLKYIDDNDVYGVFEELDTKRYYYYGSLASTVLGFTNDDNHGAYGLESMYDSVLSGTPGTLVSVKDGKGRDMTYKFQQKNDAENGDSIVLTIDQRIQQFVERNLETAVVEHSIANRASAIVMDVKTGEILAMDTENDFNPNDPYTLTDPAAIEAMAEYEKDFPVGSAAYEDKKQDYLYAQWRNKAISDPYEPGSVSKIITASTAVDNKVIALDDMFFCSGEVDVSGVPYHCHELSGHGQQTFVQAIENSCNPAFIAIGQRVGARLMFDYFDNFGFGKPTGIDLPGEANGILQPYSLLSKDSMVELSSVSFGQTFKVTPLQLITAVSAAVNGGNLMQPYVVKQVLDAEGNVIETTEPTVKRQVISAESSAIMRDLVESVVVNGSGSYAAIPGYRIGGKTGTSEKTDDLEGTEGHVLSFVGFAPMEDPQYAVLVTLDNPYLDDLYGSVIAAPVVGAILQDMLPYVGLEPTYTAEELEEKNATVPNLVGKTPHDAQAELTTRGLQTNIVGEGPKVLTQIPLQGTEIEKGLAVTLITDEEIANAEVPVPDVVGMTALEANNAIVTEAGLNIRLQGAVEDGIQTVVVAQDPLPDMSLYTGDVVTVTLAEVQ
jgi:stage V sporulation protein D (sporulation-specific penicillin-binding protein)